jgi:hypothetical protein
MKKAVGAKTFERDLSGDNQIAAYSEARSPHFQMICAALRELIDKAIPKATARVWHGSPVWFIDDNPDLTSGRNL